jgi:plastocyanin
MAKKEVNILLVIVLSIAIVGIGFLVYNQYSQKGNVVQETVSPQVESPKDIGSPGEVVDMSDNSEVSEPKQVTILIYRYDFDKPEIVIEPGTTVIWKNMDTRRHVILDKHDALQLRTVKKILEYGDTFEYTFNKVGVYEIIEANFGINGKVIVQETGSNLITGNAVGGVELSGKSFLIGAINLFVVTLALLVLGFYISRHKKN